MLATALACLPVFISGGRIARWEGAIFLAYYAAYVTYLLLQAAHHDALPAFSLAMMFFAIPLTVVTMIAVAAQSVVVRRKRSG
jgi:cation:H+ antiporter